MPSTRHPRAPAAVTFPIYPYAPQSVSAVAIEVHPLTAGHVMRALPPHAHLFFEIVLVAAGSGHHVVDGLTHEASPGTAFVLPPGAVHDMRGFGAADGWAVLFQPEGLTQGATQGLAPPLTALDPAAALLRQPILQVLRPIRLAPEPLADVLDLVKTLGAELAAKQAGYAQAAASLLQLLLIRLMRGAPWFDAASGPAPARTDFVTRVFTDIDRHFPTAGALRQAAARLGLHPAYLTHRLRRLTGRTYGHWVTERRMIEARRLLAMTDAGIAEIAAELGYAEVESFIRRFRAEHHHTPAAWRARAHPGPAEEIPSI